MSNFWTIALLLALVYLFSPISSDSILTEYEKISYLPHIEKFVGDQNENAFNEDTIVIRFADNDKVQFKNPPLFKNGSTVFHQNMGKYKPTKNVIILSPFDDYIRRSNNSKTSQRLFIALRKKSEGSNEYYVNYVYARDLFKEESRAGAVKIGSSLQRLEFDVFDRRGADNNMETRMGWAVCAKSFFISCREDAKRFFSYEVEHGPDYPDEIEAISKNEETKTEGTTEEEEGEEGDDESSVELNHGFFTDLYDEFTHAWYVGSSTIFITNTKLRINTQIVETDSKGLTNSQLTKFKRQAEDDDGSVGAKPEVEVDDSGVSASVKIDDTKRTGTKVSVRINQNGKKGKKSSDDSSNSASSSNSESDKSSNSDSESDTPDDGAAEETPAPSTKEGKKKARNTKLNDKLGSYQPSREELTRCLQWLEANKGGGRGGEMNDMINSGVNEWVKNIQGDGKQTRLRAGGGNRGRHGTEDDTGGGILKPVDKALQFFSSFLGYKPGQDSNRSPGTALMNGIRNGADVPYGLVDGLVDKITSTVGLGKISNDRSHLDGITDDFWLGIFSVVAKAVDVVDVVAKPLGLSPLLNKAASVVGGVVAGTGGLGVGAAVSMPLRLGLNLIKTVGKVTGLGGILGMKGSSDKAGITFCLNNLALLAQVKEKVKAKLAAKKAAAAGRAVGSKAVAIEDMTDLDREDRAQVDIFTPLGWKGLYSHSEEPFVGFGYCITNKTLKHDDLQNAKTPDQLATFYLTSLRTHCKEEQKARLLDLINRKVLTINKDNTFKVKKDLPSRNKAKLSKEELSELSHAFEMEIYSRVYVAELKSKTSNLRNPDNLAIHRSVNTLRNFAFEGLSEAVLNYPNHSLKLVRNILVTLKTSFVKLIQSWQILSICQRCIPMEQWIVGDDFATVVSTIEFIMDRFEPGKAESSNMRVGNIFSAYEKFYGEKRMEIGEKVSNYILPPYGRKGVPKLNEDEDVQFVPVNSDSEKLFVRKDEWEKLVNETKKGKN